VSKLDAISDDQKAAIFRDGRVKGLQDVQAFIERLTHSLDLDSHGDTKAVRDGQVKILNDLHKLIERSKP